jgi:pyridoxal phosphate enzyme (YggS family)
VSTQPPDAGQPAERPLDRAAEIGGGLGTVRARIEQACTDAGRDPAGVELIVVTKTYPAADVRILARLGVTQVGENRDQEAAPKAAELAGLGLDWHFVGQLQSNKARSVVRYATAVHSVDRESMVAALSKAAVRADRPAGWTLRCFVQVSLDGAGNRGGVRAADVLRLADRLAGADGLELAGVMAVAPLGADPSPAFARLAEISAALGEQHPDATAISAGMSGDLEQAVLHGATHLRVGSAVLGQRPPLG